MPPIVPLRLPLASWGLPAHAIARCLLPLPDGRLAVGTDYGLVLVAAGTPGGRAGWGAEPFPYPRGARREARHVEAMATCAGLLHVATARTLYRWPLPPAREAGEAAGRGLPRHPDGGLDDVRSMATDGEGLLVGFRSALKRWRGGDPGRGEAVGPGDATTLARSPEGRWYAGTLDGQLVAVGGGSRHRFLDADGHPAPVRHLAWAMGRLWIAAAGALHAWDGQVPVAVCPGEPYALLGEDHALWALARGALWRVDAAGRMVQVPAPLRRPWTLARWGRWLCVGEVGALALLDLAAP